MTANAEQVRSGPATPDDTCWCCDRDVAEAALIRLGAHPEVGICLNCARDVKRRAASREDEHRRSPMRFVRRAVNTVRGWVIARGWHERGPLGAVLRRLDRYLP